MFRIASWYESSLGRNDGNPLYVTTFLKRAQHYCDIARKRNQNDSLLNFFPGRVVNDPRAEAFAGWFMENIDPEGFEIHHLRPYGDCSEFGTFDLNLWVDWGEDGLKGVLPYEPEIPGSRLVYWASDTHLGFNHRLWMARKALVAFVAQSRAVGEFAAQGVKAEWLPHAFEPLAYPRFRLASKQYDISFVGHVNNQKRIDALDKAFGAFPKFFFGQRLFEKAAHKYAESKVVLNCAMLDDLNMRCFEVLGAGGFLLTDDIPAVREVFEDGKHLVLYKDLDDMVTKARYYIEHDDEREAIAEAGHKFVMENHTISHRVKQLLTSAYAKLKEESNVPA